MALGSSTVPAEQPFESREVSYSGGEYENETFRYRVMRPATLEEGKKYPLVLFLHGAGERGTDNEKQLQYLPRHLAKEANRTKYPCFVVAPQCRSGRQWVNVPWGAEQSTSMAKEPSHQLQVAIACLKRTLATEPVDPDRVYLTGLSMGGFGTWELAARHPEWFAAVAPICGGGDEATAPKLAKLPIRAFHGDADRVVLPVRSQRMAEAVRKAGGKPELTMYPGVGHNSWNQAYEKSDLLDWMFRQRRAGE